MEMGDVGLTFTRQGRIQKAVCCHIIVITENSLTLQHSMPVRPCELFQYAGKHLNLANSV